MKDSLLVTIILTCFNDKKNIDRAIQSIKKQTYPNIELIVVDDGSIDGSLEYIQKNYSKEPNLKILSKPNGGLGSSRAHGAQNASGDFISFLDADDEYHPKKVDFQVHDLKTIKWAILFSGATTIQGDYKQDRHTSGVTRDFTEAYCLGKDLPSANASMMLRSKDYYSWGGFSAEMRRNCEEDFLLRVLAHGGRLLIKEEPLYIVHGSVDSNRYIYQDRLPYFKKNIRTAENLIKTSQPEHKVNIVNYSRTFTKNLVINSLKWPFSYKKRLASEILNSPKEIFGISRLKYSLLAIIPVKIPASVWVLIAQIKRQRSKNYRNH